MRARMIPVFIGGTGRSGTTILKRSLAASPEFVGFRNEMRVIVDPDGVLDLWNSLDEGWSPYKGDTSLKRFSSLLQSARSTNLGKRALSRALSYVRISPPRYLALGLEDEVQNGAVPRAFEGVINELSLGNSEGTWIGSVAGQLPSTITETRRWPKATSGPVLASAVRSLFEALPGASHARGFVEDTPFNILYARELFQLFPDMYLIHIYRDPRDVIASHLEKSWGGKDVARTAQRVRAILDRWAEIRDKLPQGRVFEMSLEAFAASPWATLGPFLKTLGIEQENSTARISVEKANIGRWRRKLSTEDISVIEKIFPDLYGGRDDVVNNNK